MAFDANVTEAATMEGIGDDEGPVQIGKIVGRIYASMRWATREERAEMRDGRGRDTPGRVAQPDREESLPGGGGPDRAAMRNCEGRAVALRCKLTGKAGAAHPRVVAVGRPSRPIE